MKRANARELLDEGELDLSELEKSLREVWAVNRYMGGNPALFRHLRKMLAERAKARAREGEGAKQPLRLLDVATGLADIPLALMQWKSMRDGQASVTCIDIHPGMIELASRRTASCPSIVVAKADGTSLPYADRSFDIAFCNLALHHLDEEQAVKLLAEMDRVARIGWVVTDLERRQLAYWSAKLLARLVWRSPVTKHDGPLSVRRSYTAAEAGELLRRAGIHGGRVHKHFPFRLALVRYD